MKYRKKPIVIDAFQWPPEGPDLIVPFPDWLNEALVGGTAYVDGTFLQIKTLERTMTCALGDWVIRGIQDDSIEDRNRPIIPERNHSGELYPCKDDIFQKTYEKVESDK